MNEATPLRSNEDSALLPAFDKMALSKKGLEPSWYQGLNHDAKFRAFIALMILSYSLNPLVNHDEMGLSGPWLYFLSAVGLIIMASIARIYGVKVTVPLYGVIVDGKPVDVRWPFGWHVEQGMAGEASQLEIAARIYPGKNVSLMRVGSTSVFLDRKAVEQKGLENLLRF